MKRVELNWEQHGVESKSPRGRGEKLRSFLSFCKILPRLIKKEIMINEPFQGNQIQSHECLFKVDNIMLLWRFIILNQWYQGHALILAMSDI